MSNFASSLKDEIVRISRKEIRGEIQGLKKASAQYRADIAALKRKLAERERDITRLKKNSGSATVASADGEREKPIRFSAKGFAKLRARLGLTAEQMGQLLGVSGQSIYKWESDAARPRARNLPAIAAARAMNKREAAAMLAQMK